MSYSLSQALDQLASRSSLVELIDLVKNTAATVEGAAASVTSVLYAGDVNGQLSWQIAESLATNTASEFGQNRFVRVDDTSVGKLLNDSAFKIKLNLAVRANLIATVPNFNNLPQAQKDLLFSNAVKQVFNNTDSAGVRLPYDPNKLSLWDMASKNFVQQATGDFRVIADKVSDASILLQTELPTLLSKDPGIFGGQKIDGIELKQLLSANGDSARINAILANAHANVHVGGLSSSNLDAYKNLTQEGLAEALKDPVKLKKYEDTLSAMTADYSVRYKAGVVAASDAGKALAASGLAKGLNKLGVVGGLLGFMVAANEASAKSRDGDDDGAKEIMKIWAIDNAGSEIASIAAGAIASVGLVQNLQQAMMKHESGRLVEWVAQFVQADQAVLKALPYASIPSGLNPTRLQSHASSTASHYYRRVLRPPYNFGLSRSVKPTLLAKLPVLNGRLAPHRQTRLTEDLGDGFLTKKACRDYRPAADRQPRDMSAIL